MTICIAAVAENFNAVVVAADRMVTSMSPLYIEFEHHMPKIHEMSEKCVAMTAGDALAYSELFSAYKRKRVSTDTTISQIIDEIKELYRNIRERRITDEILSTRGFKNIEDFYGNGQGKVPQDIFYVIDRDITTYNYDLSLIVAGIDEEGAHIYGVENPGIHRCHNSIGYYIIGSGVQHDDVPSFS